MGLEDTIRDAIKESTENDRIAHITISENVKSVIGAVRSISEVAFDYDYKKPILEVWGYKYLDVKEMDCLWRLRINIVIPSNRYFY